MLRWHTIQFWQYNDTPFGQIFLFFSYSPLPLPWYNCKILTRYDASCLYEFLPLVYFFFSLNKTEQQWKFLDKSFFCIGALFSFYLSPKLQCVLLSLSLSKATMSVPWGRHTLQLSVHPPPPQCGNIWSGTWTSGASLAPYPCSLEEPIKLTQKPVPKIPHLASQSDDCWSSVSSTSVIISLLDLDVTSQQSVICLFFLHSTALSPPPPHFSPSICMQANTANIWFWTWTSGVKQALQKYLVWNMDCRSQASTAKYVVWNMDFRSFPHAQSLKKATKLTQNLHQICHRFHTNCSACQHAQHAPNWKWAQFTDDEDVNCSS